MRDKEEGITKRAKQGKQNKTAFRDEGKKERGEIKERSLSQAAEESAGR